jgi:hypothetical protein
MKRPLARTSPFRRLAGAVLLSALPAIACAAGDGAGDPPAAPAAAEEEAPAAIVGPTTREAIEAADPSWVTATVEAEIDEDDAAALAAVDPGAEVTVFLGTWCSDSRRELPRLWRALDEVGGLVPFEIEYVAVDRDKEEPAGPIEGAGIEYVPTFVVRRGGEEVGRVVETSPSGIETDLLALLTGEASGVLSARDDL